MKSRDGTHLLSPSDWRVRMTVDRIYKSVANDEQYAGLIERTPSLKKAVNYFREKESSLLERQLKSREEKHVLACPDWRIKRTLQHIDPINNGVIGGRTSLNTPNSNFCTDLPARTHGIFKRCAQLKIIDETTRGKAIDEMRLYRQKAAANILKDFSTAGGKVIDQGSVDYVRDVLYDTPIFYSTYSGLSEPNKLVLYKGIPKDKQVEFFRKIIGSVFVNTLEGTKLYCRLPLEEQKDLYPKLSEVMQIAILKLGSGVGKEVKEQLLLTINSTRKRISLVTEAEFTSTSTVQAFKSLSDQQKASLLSSLPLVDKERFSPDILEASPASSSLVHQGGGVQASPRWKSVKAESVVAGPESLKSQRVAALRASIEASENKLRQDAVRNAETGIGDLVEKEVSRQLDSITNNARAKREKSEARLREVKARKAAEKEAAKKRSLDGSASNLPVQESPGGAKISNVVLADLLQKVEMQLGSLMPEDEALIKEVHQKAINEASREEEDKVQAAIDEYRISAGLKLGSVPDAKEKATSIDRATRTRKEQIKDIIKEYYQVKWTNEVLDEITKEITDS